LRGNLVVLGNTDKVIFKLFDHSLVTLGLIDWGKWMHIAKPIPRNWNHANCRVELHRTRSKRHHRISEGYVFLTQPLNVSHHSSLGKFHLELGLLHKFWISSDVERYVEIVSFFEEFERSSLIKAHHGGFSFFNGCKNFNYFVEVIQTGKLVKWNTYLSFAYLSDINSIFMELG